MAAAAAAAAAVVSVEDCGPEGFRWITLKKITWQDPAGRWRLWESAERTTRRGDIDGVAIVAKACEASDLAGSIVGAGRAPLLPVLKQYRPPVANYCLELPAGLVDAGESAGQAAVRELLEETGYTGRVVEETAVCVSDAGMSNANMRYVTLEVDSDAPENQNVVQQLEDGEFIQVELVPWAGLMQHLQREMAATGCEVDARLLSYAYGLEHAKQAVSAAAPGPPPRTHQQHAAPACHGESTALLKSSTSGAPLPFGSPVISPQASSAQPPPAVSVGAQGHATAHDGKGGWHGSGMPLLVGALPLFAVGAAVGAAGCWLLLAARGR